MEDTKPEETNVEEQKVSIFEDCQIKPLQSVRLKLLRYITVTLQTISPIESKRHRIKGDLCIQPTVISLIDVMIALFSV